ncbi:hypothetical protein [Spongiibacter tropicus]|uniref:hypothetical protein n=1 Tax=Spongiibacter tropicus TaxID=454602 RepID=UPI0003B37091|nr:hypothetical protein [Spongiibacter tropicus]
METISVKKVSAGTVFKLIAIGLICGFMPIFALFGVMGAFGMENLTWNSQAVTGVKAIFAGPLMGIFIALLFTASIGSVVAFGLWIFSFFKPIKIEYISE